MTPEEIAQSCIKYRIDHDGPTGTINEGATVAAIAKAIKESNLASRYDELVQIGTRQGLRMVMSKKHGPVFAAPKGFVLDEYGDVRRK